MHATRTRKPVDAGQLFDKCQHLQYWQAKINVLLCGTLFLLMEGFQKLPKLRMSHSHK